MFRGLRAMLQAAETIHIYLQSHTEINHVFYVTAGILYNVVVDYLYVFVVAL